LSFYLSEKAYIEYSTKNREYDQYVNIYKTWVFFYL
jgi:hypothetical protein